MIVPRNRLLIWVALIVIPFALLAGVEPAAAAVSLGVIGAFVLLILVDAFGARRGQARERSSSGVPSRRGGWKCPG